MRQATVLKEYQRLEAEGVWRPAPEAQRRDVVVSIGEATLMLTDPNDNILTHWSLPAVRRLNPGARPAIYSPGPDAPDTLELTDPNMIDALTRVSKAIRRGQSHPGRLRTGILAAVTLVIVAAAVLWFPGALTRYTASILPEATREAIGRDLVAEVRRVTGAPCDAAPGLRALERLEERLFGDADRTLIVVPSALVGTAHVPGGRILIDHRLIEDAETPDLLAAALLTENARLMDGDPVERLLSDLGVGASFRLLTTGEIGPDAIARYAATLIATVQDSGPAVAPTVPGAGPILSDGNWIALQQICEG